MGRLEGKVAFVTGANSGIGRAAALALADEGAHVALVARREDPLREVAAAIEAKGKRAIYAPLDVADEPAVSAFVQRIASELGRIDVAVFSAGTNTKRRYFDEVTPDDFRRVIDVNLNGMFYCVRAVLPVMRAQREGTIINISSGAGKRASLLTGSAYSVSKFGVDALTQSINLEERRHGIRACVIFPGEVDTPILQTRPVPVPEEERDRMLKPEDLADALLLVACLPQRATVEEMVIRPTHVRDTRAEQRPASV